MIVVLVTFELYVEETSIKMNTTTHKKIIQNKYTVYDYLQAKKKQKKHGHDGRTNEVT